MRPPPPTGAVELSAAAEIAEFSLIHLSPPLSSPSPSSTRLPRTCVSHTCRWWPYSSSKEFEANASMIIIILLSALICALGLNAAIRCFLRGGTNNPQDRDHHTSSENLPRTQRELHAQQKSNVVAGSCLEMAPEMVYTAEMRAKLAGAEAECAICLSEFVEGEGIRVLGRCKHGFHAQCIQKWLSSHSSCPTCRRTCLPPSPSQSPPPPQPVVDHHSQQNSIPESRP